MGGWFAPEVGLVLRLVTLALATIAALATHPHPVEHRHVERRSTKTSLLAK